MDMKRREFLTKSVVDAADFDKQRKIMDDPKKKGLICAHSLSGHAVAALEACVA